MQSYTDYTYRFDRILFAVMLCMFCSFASLAKVEMDSKIKLEPVDTLFARWNKSRTQVPFLIHELSNVSDLLSKQEANHAIEQYGVGIIQITKGKLEDAKSWISKTNAREKTPPVFQARIENVFQLPYQTDVQFPDPIEVETVVTDSLVYQLGLQHGTLLKRAGFDGVHFDDLPKYYSLHELSKVEMYLSAIKQCGLTFSLSSEATLVGHWVGWAHVSFWQDNFQGKYKQLAKSRKEFRKQSGFQGLYVANFDATRPLSKGHNQISEGLGAFYNSSSTEGLDAIMKSDGLGKSDAKKAVRSYYTLWRRIKSEKGLMPELCPVDVLMKSIADQALVVIRDESLITPIGDLKDRAVITIMDNKESEHLVDLYKSATHWGAGVLDRGIGEIEGLLVAKQNLFIVDLNQLADSMRLQNLIDLQHSHDVIGLYQGDMATLQAFDNVKTVIWSPRLANDEKLKMIQVAFGAGYATGKLPGYFNPGDERVGLDRTEQSRLRYFDMNTDEVVLDRLIKIDTIVARAIRNQEIPGCQVMMVKGGQVIYNKNFGYHTYDSVQRVRWDDIYDIASVTKTTATVPVIMKATEQGQMTLESTIGDHLAGMKQTDKADITISKLLQHESGLLSYYPFWAKAHFDSTSHTYQYKERKKGWRKAYNYYTVHWEDSVNGWLSKARFNRLRNDDGSHRYLYSDIGFMMLKQIAERTSTSTLDDLADSLVYSPLGMNFTSFNPLRKFDASRIVPTEDDIDFRGQLLRGQVHDKNAALLDGVSGHAGLFSNANDLAKYMYMMLKNGRYGGEQYFKAGTVKKFVKKSNENNRRGLGWDKPSYSVSNASNYASMESFGHSGFTGTLVWADPKHDLIFIFLSNRIHPDAQNYKLIRNNTRSRIHDVMYESIISIDNIVHSGL